MSALGLKREKELRKEEEARIHIPYVGHLTTETVLLENEVYCQVLRLDGASFETANDEAIDSWRNKLHNVIRGFADPRITIWHTLIRDESNEQVPGDYEPGFCAEFARKYAEKVGQEVLMRNDIYVAILFSPQTSKVGKSITKIAKMADKKAIESDAADALEYLQKVVADCVSGMERYDVRRLGCYEYNGLWFTEVGEFFAYLLNSEWQRVPLTHHRMAHQLQTSRLFSGKETIELRRTQDQVYSAFLGVKTYPPRTFSGMLNDLLSAPFPFVLTQSFGFMSKEAALFLVSTQRNRLINVGDASESQVDEMKVLMDDIQANRVTFGNHHLTLQVKGYTPKQLRDSLGVAKSMMSDQGIMTAREDLALEAAYWAQLPGNFKYRPRVAPITSKNFCDFASNHNFPSGRRTGNHWGDAITQLTSDADTPVYFSYHASDPTEADGGSRKDVGDALVLGPKGTGKTLFVAAMNAFSQKYGLTSIFFTKDRDTEIYIRAIGGAFLPMRAGQPTGMNFYQLDPTPENIVFWNEQCADLIRRSLTVSEENELAAANRWIATLDKRDRRIGRLLEYLDPNTELYTYIAQWCYSIRQGVPDGIYAYVFDNKKDIVIPHLSGKTLTVGVDVTDFLDKPVLCGPILNYCWFLVNKLVDGRRMVVHVAEFWKPLSNPRFVKELKDALKTWRKKNAHVVLDSQSPSDALSHPEARTLIEQTSTKILFPNDEADEDEYCNGLNLSKREFKLIKEDLTAGRREFLLKQGKNTIVAKFDLKGFDFELDVLSGREQNVLLLERIREIHGEDPAVWLPIFKEQRKGS